MHSVYFSHGKGRVVSEAACFSTSWRDRKNSETQTQRAVSIGAVHSTLTRLEDKGFLKSEMGNSTAERGGRRKRIYSITAYGRRALENSRDFRVSLWKQYPAFADKFSYGF